MAKRHIFLTLFAAMIFSLFTTSIAQASFEQGKKAYDRKDWRQAIYYLRPLAESGDARAMVVLGNMYSQGLGVGQDDKEAFSLYRKAAGLNNPDAMAAVGAMYQQGRGVPKNMRLSAGWYGRAAQAGQRAAAPLYALLLYRGNKSDDPDQDLKPDHIGSYKWFSIAAGQSQNGKAQSALRRMANKVAEKLDRRDIARVDGEVTVWKPLPADSLGPFPEEIRATEEKKDMPSTPEQK